MSEATQILVVEDESVIAMALQLKLQTMGYEVPATAGSGEEAIELASELKPFLVLMDIHLNGGMDGVEAAGVIRKTCGAGVVFLTAYSDEATLQRAKLTEPFGYILKPIVDRELRIVVEMAIYKRKAEIALQLSEEKFRTVLETAGDAVVSADAQGNIIYFNRAAERLFCFSAAEAKRVSVTRLMPERYHEAFRLGLNRYASNPTGEPDRAIAFFGLRKDGSEFPVEVSLASWKSAEGLHFTAIIRDITPRLRAEEALRLNQELTEINRAKDAFLAVVSHELRTPLTAMLGWTRLLRAGTLDDAGEARALGIVERNMNVLNKLVEDLLDVSRLVTGKLGLNKRAVEITEIVRGAVETIRPAASAKGVELVLDLCPETVVVQADLNRMQQILYNLLSNALKFTAAGGKITIKVRREAERVSIAIGDNGIGIEPEYIPRVFDRFWQADLSATRTFQGMGLGLAVVRELVELHGGTVSAESVGKGKGATFTVFLPVSIAPAAE